jgi:hypothetical protein
MFPTPDCADWPGALPPLPNIPLVDWPLPPKAKPPDLTPLNVDEPPNVKVPVKL